MTAKGIICQFLSTSVISFFADLTRNPTDELEFSAKLDDKRRRNLT